jgi:hypothetical protein
MPLPLAQFCVKLQRLETYELLQTLENCILRKRYEYAVEVAKQLDTRYPAWEETPLHQTFNREFHATCGSTATTRKSLKSSDWLADRWPARDWKRFSVEYCESHALAVFGIEGIESIELYNIDSIDLDLTPLEVAIKNYSVCSSPESTYSVPLSGQSATDLKRSASNTYAILIVTSPYRGDRSTEYAKEQYAMWAAKKAIGLRSSREITAQRASRRR